MTQDMIARAQLVEAMAWWRLSLTDGRAILASAATETLLAGLGGEALAELAGIPARRFL